MYKILYFINQRLSFINCEIRKKQTAPFYYVQYFSKPDYPDEKGVYTIPIDKIISPHGFSYGADGWHYYTDCLKECIQNSEIEYKNSVLKQYYDTFQPNNIADILHIENETLKRLPALLIRDFFVLDGSAEDVQVHLIEEETQLYGPISDIYGEEQFIRCVNAHRLIKKHGYIPERFEDGYIGGFFIKKGNDYRFLAFAGKHRLAALSVLGYTEIKANCPYKLKLLDCARIQSWPTVKSGLFKKQEMQEIISQIFDQDGTSFAARYGLLNNDQDK